MTTIEQLTGIVREASRLMVSDGFEIEQKGGCENIVTSSDVAVQNFLCERLLQLLPGSGFLCEEKDINDTRNEYTWIIDPIDGTANYSRGIDQCAICVGLKHNDDMQMGVVYIPRTDELFYAEKGKGAYLNGRRIHVSSRPFSNAVLCTALSVYHKEYGEVCSRIIADAFGKCNDIRRFGACAPELCYLAMGRCELYFEYLLSSWDYAAASLIVTEAGGIITSADGSKLCLTEPMGVIAANNMSNYRQLLDIVSDRYAPLTKKELAGGRLNQLSLAMIDYNNGDPKRIQHTTKVHAYASLIGKCEGLDEETQFILETAALVHDIGIRASEQKYGYQNGKLQEQEGPAVARELLTRLGGYTDQQIERICWLVAHHHTYHVCEDLDYQILIEADFLVNLFEDDESANAIRAVRRNIFRTESGIRMLETMFGID